jgi:hypothetical protein
MVFEIKQRAAYLKMKRKKHRSSSPKFDLEKFSDAPRPYDGYTRRPFPKENACRDEGPGL